MFETKRLRIDLQYLYLYYIPFTRITENNTYSYYELAIIKLGAKKMLIAKIWYSYLYTE